MSIFADIFDTKIRGFCNNKSFTNIEQFDTPCTLELCLSVLLMCENAEIVKLTQYFGEKKNAKCILKHIDIIIIICELKFSLIVNNLCVISKCIHICYRHMYTHTCYILFMYPDNWSTDKWGFMQSFGVRTFVNLN